MKYCLAMRNCGCYSNKNSRNDQICSIRTNSSRFHGLTYLFPIGRMKNGMRQYKIVRPIEILCQLTTSGSIVDAAATMQRTMLPKRICRAKSKCQRTNKIELLQKSSKFIVFNLFIILNWSRHSYPIVDGHFNHCKSAMEATRCGRK